MRVIREEATTKAVAYDRYGSPDVLRLQEIDTPVPGDDEVLVQVAACGANPADWHYMRGLPYVARLMIGVGGPRKGVVIGHDISGRVEAVGGEVTRFAPGDEVFTELDKYGGCAEYVAFPESRARRMPANLTSEQAAAVPMAGMTALVGLRDVGNVQPGQRVLVNGASGGVGTFAVQIAKALGAEVTGVCSTRNVELVRSIGADHVIDYAEEDFTKGDQCYDMVFDCVGNRSMSEYRRVLTPKGVYGATGGGGGKVIGPLANLLKAYAASPFVSQKMTAINDKPNRDLDCLTELIEAGKVTPVIDKVYPLAETAEAMRHLESGRARGKIVIVV